ncbi:MAG: FAD-dependent oxidoreductase, partial [bacterium]
MGDTGLLAAERLARGAELTVVAPTGGMVSGQELGLRLAWPETWLSTSLFAAGRYRALRGARVVHGRAVGVDPASRAVEVERADGGRERLPYDVLIIATGTTSGFWRSGAVEPLEAVEARVRAHAARLQAAAVVAVVGGGPSGVSVAVNLKR